MPSKGSRNFELLGINHLGLAVKDPKKTRWFFTDVLGLTMSGEETVQDQKVHTVMYEAVHDANKALASRLEILIPTPTGEGPVAKFLEKKGAGIHHMAIGCDNVDAVLAHLKAHGVKLIDEVPRQGAHATKIIFVHPEATGGLLIEFVQETASKGSPNPTS